MSRPFIPADPAVRLALQNCFEKDNYEFDPDGVRYLKRNGLDRYATAAAVLRHLRESRHLYCKRAENGLVLPRQYHGEVALRDDDSVIAYMHFIIAITGNETLVRAHANGFPGSLPWSLN